ncbi:MAG: DUF2785 domain-containing protein [Anaerolineales bacterium]|nr:DUF2785 domain-containing protein [Anaerolineales bacterium]
MDKEFWAEIQKNQYEIPAGQTLAGLTRELFSYLGSTDPQLRDDIGYIVFANWLKQDRYSVEEIRAYIKKLLANLHIGIGENESDSVFLRTFSVLFLAEIVHNDNKKRLLEKADITPVLEQGLWYIASEKDPRGYIPVLGWAHALAHTADLLMVLARNRHLEEPDFLNILNAISEKIIHSTNYIYIHGEDERLASAVNQILRRDQILVENIKAWAGSFTKHDWADAYTDEYHNRAFQNTRNLLRSIYLELKQSKEGGSKQVEFESIFLEAIENLKPF